MVVVARQSVAPRAAGLAVEPGWAAQARACWSAAARGILGRNGHGLHVGDGD